MNKHDTSVTDDLDDEEEEVDRSYDHDPLAEVSAVKKRRPVLSFNEWDPLEEVMIGNGIDGTSPPRDPNLNVSYNSDEDIYVGDGCFHRFRGRLRGYYRDGQFFGRKAWGTDWFEIAQAQLDNLERVLKNEGVTVVRPDLMDFEQPIVSGDGWSVRGQYGATCPRDSLIVVGDQIIEATMAARVRTYETSAFRTLLKGYWRDGARWVACPRAQLVDASYNFDFPAAKDDYQARLQALADPKTTHLTDFEPIWEAADCVRMGKDMFFQRSLVSSELGIEWFRRHVEPEGYRVHTVTFPDDPAPVHIDASFTPLRPYLAISNPVRTCDKKQFFQDNGWELIEAPESVRADTKNPRRCSWWLNMNVLSVSPDTVCVESLEQPMVKMLESRGFRVLQVPFKAVYELGGSFHCATLDVRRRGICESYFPTLDNQPETVFKEDH